MMRTSAALLLIVTITGVFDGYLSNAAESTPFPMGYLEVTNDLRYEEKLAYARIRVKPHDRPRPGAELAVRGSRIIGRASKIKFSLEVAEGSTAADLIFEVERLWRTGIRFFLIDADAAFVNAVAEATKDRELLLLNISEPADILRGSRCRVHLAHTIPSHAMLTDALAQFLATRKWRDVLVLKGPLPDDAAFAQAFEGSAARFGIRIVKVRDFMLGNDPREREKNNVALMTAEGDYDVVFLADTEGEFGRYVPYQTNLVSLVIGTEGLIAEAWHWAWERHGAPQLNQRFEKYTKRRMTGTDWAAWAAIKAIVESAVRTKSADFKTTRAYLLGDEMTLDGYKGTPSSFRSWDNQLRQPILLRTHNAVIERAPIKGFLHPTENMDTLGYDRGDRKCRLGQQN